MTEKQLIDACKRADAKNQAEERAKIIGLARAMTSPKFKFYGWELAEVERLIHGAYGRMKING